MAFLKILDEERKRRARIAGAALVAKRLNREKPRWLVASSVVTEAQAARNIRRLPNSAAAVRVRRNNAAVNWPPPAARTCACH